MNDWYEYQTRKLTPKNARGRTRQSAEPPAEPSSAPKGELTSEMIVEESTASDTLIQRIKRFWNP